MTSRITEVLKATLLKLYTNANLMLFYESSDQYKQVNTHQFQKISGSDKNLLFHSRLVS